MLNFLFENFVCVLLSVNFALLAVNAFFWKRRFARKEVGQESTINILAVLGSGGHTTEMLRLIGGLGAGYSRRSYVLANTDKLSRQKVEEYESTRTSGTYNIFVVPRSREVGQNYLTAVFSTLAAFFHSFGIFTEAKPDVVLSNGPGTGLPICVIAAITRAVGLTTTKVVFVESICRVKSLSLTGLILYKCRAASRILVQWPELVDKYPGTEYIGRLV